MTSFSSVPCSNKHPGKKNKKKTFYSSLCPLRFSGFPPHLSLSLSVCFPSLHLLLGDTPWPDGSDAATFANQNQPYHTHRESILVLHGRDISRSVLTMCPLGCYRAAVYSWSPSVQASQAFEWDFKKRLVLFILLPKSRDPGLIPCSHSIKSNSPKIRKWLYQMAVHTEICSNTSAGFKSQGNTMLRQERRHKMCLSAGPRKTL